MLKTIKKIYYFGEFGYFNFIILGYLEEYLRKNNKTFIIKTYDDYYRILNHKFPNRFLQSAEKIAVDYRAKRIYHRIQNADFNKSLYETGWTPLEELLQCDVSDWKEARKKIKPIDTPLIEKTAPVGQCYVSILCRKRIIDKDRNLSFDSWRSIVQGIKDVFYEYPLVFHGLKEETIDMKDGDAVFCSDIIKAIEYLNNSIVFVSSMSGFAQFASNCNCSILQIGPAFQMIPYNPFQKTNLQIDRSEIGKIKDYIKQFSL